VGAFVHLAVNFIVGVRAFDRDQWKLDLAARLDEVRKAQPRCVEADICDLNAVGISESHFRKIRRGPNSGPGLNALGACDALMGESVVPGAAHSVYWIVVRDGFYLAQQIGPR
jgi:hypothetical protein